MPIRIEIEVDEHGVIQKVGRVEQSLERVEGAGKKAGAGTDKFSASIDRLGKYIVGGGIVYGLERLASKGIDLGKNFAETAGRFEQLRVSLDTITKGRGDEWFARLNMWALRMPINTEAAVRAYTRLRAMGLEPTIKDMTTLVDTTSALGGHTDTFDGIVLALGQIATKGELMAQEIRQLAERGIPAYEILNEKLGITGKQLEGAGREAVDANKAIRALLEGMEERFGGQSERIMGTYAGIKEQLVSDWKEYQRVMMDAGPFEVVKGYLREVDEMVRRMRDNAGEKLYRRGAEKYFEEFGIEPEGVVKGRLGIPRLASTRLPGQFNPETGIYEHGGDTAQMFRRYYTPEQYRQYEYYRTQQKKIRDYLADYTGKSKSGAGGGGSAGGGFLSVQDRRAIFDVIGMQEFFPEYTGDLYGSPFRGGPGVLGNRDTSIYRANINRMAGQFGTGQWGPTPEEIEKYNDEVLRLQQSLTESRISLQFDGYERERELLRAQFDFEYGAYEENDERRKLAAEKLQNDLAAIERMGAEARLQEQARGWIMLGDTISNTMMHAMQTSGNAFENIAKSFEAMLENMAAQWAARGAVFMALNGLTGGGFSAVTGINAVTAILRGFSDGGYTGSTGGIVHPHEYVIPERTVAKYGAEYFDRIVNDNRQYSTNTTTLSILGRSAANRQEFADALRDAVRDDPEVRRLFREVARS